MPLSKTFIPSIASSWSSTTPDNVTTSALIAATLPEIFCTSCDTAPMASLLVLILSLRLGISSSVPITLLTCAKSSERVSTLPERVSLIPLRELNFSSTYSMSAFLSMESLISLRASSSSLSVVNLSPSNFSPPFSSILRASSSLNSERRMLNVFLPSSLSSSCNPAPAS